MKSASFTLTGKHVLAIFIGFFAVVLTANAIFITLAVKSFPGEQEKKSYLQGLHFNTRIEEREAQNALGWRAEITAGRIESGEAAIDLAFTTAAGRPLSGLTLSGVLTRPASDEFDAALTFEEVGAGLYRAYAPAAAGAWRVQASTKNERGDRFELEKRLTIE